MSETLKNRTLPISVKQMNFATGTWTYTYASGIEKMRKTATDETATVTIPIHIPRQSDQHGVKLKSIDVMIRVATADLDAVPGCTLYRQDFDLVVAGATGDQAAVAVTTTDNGVVTADAQDRLLTITVTNPALDYGTETTCAYLLELTFNAAASTVVDVYKAFAKYEELV